MSVWMVSLLLLYSSIVAPIQLDRHPPMSSLLPAEPAAEVWVHKHAMGENQLARGLAYTGAALRLRRTLQRLQAGESVHVGIVGGDLTAHAPQSSSPSRPPKHPQHP